MPMTCPSYEKANWSWIPEHMRGPMKEYIENGLTPGSFLTAVLSNDLRDAVLQADDINKTLLPQYIEFLVWYLPAIAWGSTELVERWTSHGGMNGYEEDNNGGEDAADTLKVEPIDGGVG